MKPKKDRKKLKETRIGAWLVEKAPDILATVGDILPDSGGLGIVKNLIERHTDISEEDKAAAMEIIKLDLEFEKEFTARWQADMSSDSWLSKNIRPLVLGSAVLMLFVFMILDSAGIKFDVKESWISLYELVLLTTIAGYFGSRTYEKVKLR